MVSSNSEAGSLAPLGIGLATLSLLVVITMASAGSLYLTERRLTFVAEATALSVISNPFPISDIRNSANEFLSKHPLHGLTGVRLIEASADDGKTVLVRLCSTWIPIIPSYMFSETGRVCSEGLARRGR